MTRKDVEFIAEALHESKARAFGPFLVQWNYDCKVIADMLLNQNSRFNRGKFLKACAEGINRENVS